MLMGCLSGLSRRIARLAIQHHSTIPTVEEVGRGRFYMKIQTFSFQSYFPSWALQCTEITTGHRSFRLRQRRNQAEGWYHYWTRAAATRHQLCQPVTVGGGWWLWYRRARDTAKWCPKGWLDVAQQLLLPSFSIFGRCILKIAMACFLESQMLSF